MITKPMEGKICLITGSTNGIGKSAALALAKMGATVVITGRNATRTAQVVQEIRARSGNHKVDSFLADLSSQNEVRRLADEFKGKYQDLHVLLNNAGAAFMKRQLSVDGIEMTFALNHLAPFLLTDLLLGRLKASAPARMYRREPILLERSSSTTCKANGPMDLGRIPMQNWRRSCIQWNWLAAWKEQVSL
jgi:retinol dehydrogenase 12